MPSSAPGATQPTLYSRMPGAGADPLRRLLDESADLIESPTATHIMTLLLDTVFSQLTDVALRSQAFKIAEPSQDPALRVQELDSTEGLSTNPEPGKTKTKLATILAVVSRQAHLIGNGVPNTYVQSMEGVRELEAFAAVVYSSNFELDQVHAEAARVMHEESEHLTPTAENNTQSQGIGAATRGLFEGVWGRATGRGS
jgi:peroxin-3